MISTGQIKLIHLAKTRLGLTGEEYREILALYGDAASSKDLTPEGFFRVMEHFRELGFPEGGSRIFGVPARTETGKLIEMVTPAQRALIAKLSGALGWSDNPGRLEGFIHKRLGMDRVRTRAQAIKVIEALKAILRREIERDAG
ncbi:MAG: regulatory protein GemA [Nitrospirae bacterium]|nr:regulatory protein GemA [Nitrospirota bacterium]MBI5696081.1 regulatory protein GemA [Nitrospirota bacterium]